MTIRKFSFAALWLALGGAGILTGAPAHAETRTSNWPISLTVVQGCQIRATPMAFGIITGQAGLPTTTATVSLQCNPNINYVISIDNGLNAQGINRRMRNPVSGQFLRYRIYSNAALSQRWETQASRRVSGNSGASGITSHTAYGQITDASAGQQTGAYFDTVTVTVEF